MTKTHILRTCAHDMTSHGGFVWPKSGRVVAPDWNPAPECGGGLHGFLMGEGDGRPASWDGSAVWIIAEVEAESVVDLGGKVKFPEANVIFAGARFEATNLIRSLGASGAVIGATATAGDYSTATAGYRGTATAGHRGTATAGHRGTATAGHHGTATAGDYGTAMTGEYGTTMAGYCGTATAGDCGTATAGEYGTATAGYCGTATTGHRGTATAGYCGTATAGYCGTAMAGEDGTATAGHRGTAMAGEGGALQIAFFDTRNRIAVAYVGENGILPNVAYRLDSSNQFIKA